MKYRYAEVLAHQDLGPSGTETIDIKVKDCISRLTLLHYPSGGSNTIIAHPVANIEQIELWDGGTPLWTLTGYQAHALGIIEAKRPRATYIDARTSAQPLIEINIDFGRWLWDTELAFNPERFVNPQIKLTWNEANYDASCTEHTFAIFAHLFDEKSVSPVGYLMSREVKSYEPTSGAYEYTELPRDYILRKLLIQAFKKGAGVRGLCQEIKLSENNDKKVPLDGDIFYLRAFLDPLAGEAIDTIKVQAAATPTEMYITPHNVLAGVVTNDTADKVARLYPYSGGYVIVESETAEHRISALVRGKNPHGMISIPFGDQDDMGDWYDVPSLGSLRLRILGGSNSSSGDEINVIVQQLRRYD